MMKTFDIEVGGVYTNATELFAREVLSIIDGSVLYRDFMLSDGTPISPGSRCSLSHFQRWSARPATPEESSRLRKEESDAPLWAMIREMIPLALGEASDEALLAEVHRRGWRLEGEWKR
jgi:hypothetical protein